MGRDSFMRDGKGNYHSASHRRAPIMEKALAERTNGKTIPGSGCSYQKGDVRIKGIVRIEAKTTKNRSFSVTREMVRKIEDAALPAGEMPAIVIEFLDDAGKPESEVVVLPSYAIDQLLRGE